jgi:hypothetical protein
MSPIVTSGGGSGGITSLPAAQLSRAAAVGGNLTLNSSAAYSELAAATGGPGTGGFDLTVAAAVSDVLLLTGYLLCNNAIAESVFIDVATWVTGAAVNWLGQSAGSNANNGLAEIFSAIATGVTPAIQYVVQAGDISGGNVTLRPFYLTSAAANRTMTRSVANGALSLQVVNLKH